MDITDARNILTESGFTASETKHLEMYPLTANSDFNYKNDKYVESLCKGNIGATLFDDSVSLYTVVDNFACRETNIPLSEFTSEDIAAYEDLAAKKKIASFQENAKPLSDLVEKLGDNVLYEDVRVATTGGTWEGWGSKIDLSMVIDKDQVEDVKGEIKSWLRGQLKDTYLSPQINIVKGGHVSEGRVDNIRSGECADTNKGKGMDMKDPQYLMFGIGLQSKLVSKKEAIRFSVPKCWKTLEEPKEQVKDSRPLLTEDDLKDLSQTAMEM